MAQKSAALSSSHSGSGLQRKPGPGLVESRAEPGGCRQACVRGRINNRTNKNAAFCQGDTIRAAGSAAAAAVKDKRFHLSRVL